jgi:hypothetical protein
MQPLLTYYQEQTGKKENEITPQEYDALNIALQCCTERLKEERTQELNKE